MRWKKAGLTNSTRKAMEEKALIFKAFSFETEKIWR